MGIKACQETLRHRTKALFDSLVLTLDYRDAETQWHSRRVAAYAKFLAQRCGIRGEALTVIEHGALFHDIGKIGVRDDILFKPGPLTEAEGALMRRHPELGYDLLSKVDVLRSAAAIVLQHQERWDGTGYPQRLAGEDIALGARIFNVVDTLDAMLSERPYRAAVGLDAVRAEMRACSGTQFDPALVQEFLKVPNSDWEALRRDVTTTPLHYDPPGLIQTQSGLD